MKKKSNLYRVKKEIHFTLTNEYIIPENIANLLSDAVFGLERTGCYTQIAHLKVNCFLYVMAM